MLGSYGSGAERMRDNSQCTQASHYHVDQIGPNVGSGGRGWYMALLKSTDQPSVFLTLEAPPGTLALRKKPRLNQSLTLPQPFQATFRSLKTPPSVQYKLISKSLKLQFSYTEV